jgi:carboxymethylenebutenolidase
MLAALGGCAPMTTRTAVTGPLREAVAYPSGKETVHGVVCHPAEEGTFPAVVLVHGDFGLTDYVKDQAERLARRGYVVLAVDLYRGEAPADLMDAHIMSRLPDDQALADLRAAVDYLAGRSDVRGDRVGILGWELGGGYALDAAQHDGRLHAVVTCYGRLTTDPNLLKPLGASVFGIFAGKDEGISADTIAQFRAAMAKAGKRVAGIHVYPDCGNGFLDPAAPGATGPAADAARADAWDKIDAYLDAELKR